MANFEDSFGDTDQPLHDWDSNSEPLNTSPPPTNLTEGNQIDYLLSSDDKDLPMSSNEYYLLQPSAVVPEQDNKLIEKEKTSHGYGQLPQQFVQSNAFGHNNSHQLYPRNDTFHPSSIDELFSLGIANTTITENIGTSMNRNSEGMKLNFEAFSRSSSSVLNSIAMENSHNQNDLITTDNSHSKDQLMNYPEEIDKILSQKNQGKTQRSLSCDDLNARSTRELTPLTDHAVSTMPKSSPVTYEQQQHTKESISNPLDYQLSGPLTTTNEYLNSKEGSFKMSLLHPLRTQLESKTNRSTQLMGSDGEAPVVIVYGDRLLKGFRIEISVISHSENGDYHSVYEFHNGKETITYTIEKCDEESTRIVLKDLKIQKKPVSDMKIQKKSTANMKNKRTFRLNRYPSGKEEDCMVKGPKEFVAEYNLKKVQLAIRMFPNKSSEPYPVIFYSNILTSEQLPAPGLLKMTLNPNGNKISFDGNNCCQMDLSAELPEELHCTLDSGYKGLEVSIIMKDNLLSSIYYIGTRNGDVMNPCCFQIQNKSLKESFYIAKRTPDDQLLESQAVQQVNNSDNNINTMSCKTDPNRFFIQVQLLHYDGSSNSSPNPKDYLNYPPWKSDEFQEDIESSNHSESSITIEEPSFGHKRMREESDFSLGLPITKVPKSSTNNDEYFHTIDQ